MKVFSSTARCCVFYQIIICLLLLPSNLIESANTATESVSHQKELHDSNSASDASEHAAHGIRVASWRWKEYGAKFLMILMLILSVIVKIGYHKIPFFSKFIPESCFLIVLGIVLASLSFVARLTCDDSIPIFTAERFFNILLPPIILDASFTLYDRDFLSNIGTILTFAFVGTLFNTFSVGLSLYGIQKLSGPFEVNVADNIPCGMSMETANVTELQEFNLTLTESLVFSSLISAVDPVAVLAIFEEIGVNTALYFTVFGESLLNDGVTVVLYNAMLGMSQLPEITGLDMFVAFIGFFFVVFGGFIIGITGGFLVSLITTKTKGARDIEPLLVFALAYLTFIMAELVHWSGILAIIGFGVTVKRYAMNNVAKQSYTTIKYATRTMAATSDCIIFLFLGMVVVTETHLLHWPFILTTISLCTLYRFIGTFFLSWLVNMGRTQNISYRDQFIIAYGGLRGAVGFSLAQILDENLWYRELFLSTALGLFAH